MTFTCNADSNIYDQVHNISGKILESYGAFVNKDKTVVVNQTTTKTKYRFRWARSEYNRSKHQKELRSDKFGYDKLQNIQDFS